MVPSGCPLVTADFTVGQGQVKFRQRPRVRGVSTAPWVSLVPSTEGARNEEKAKQTRGNSNKNPLRWPARQPVRGVFHTP